MRVLFRLIGDERKASSRVRGYWIAAELERLQFSTSKVVCNTKRDYLAALASIARHDCVIFQKVFSRYDVMAAMWARQLGKRVIFDIDDAPNPSLSGPGFQRAKRMFGLADRVMAGSGALVELVETAAPIARGKTMLVPTSIRIENYAPPERDPSSEAITLGWIGNGGQYAPDLVKVLLEPLAKLGQSSRLKLRIVGACGNRDLHAAFSDIPGISVDLVDQIDWASPEAINREIQSFDIGLYPLLETEFNHYKCGFKALEYMACAVPVVASPVGANSEVVQDNRTGLIARDTQEWIQAIGQLAKDAGIRQKFGKAGQARVKEQYSLARVAEQVADVVRGASAGPENSGRLDTACGRALTR